MKWPPARAIPFTYSSLLNIAFGKRSRSVHLFFYGNVANRPQSFGRNCRASPRWLQIARLEGRLWAKSSAD
jgi:hypothetical protein